MQPLLKYALGNTEGRVTELADLRTKKHVANVARTILIAGKYQNKTVSLYNATVPNYSSEPRAYVTEIRIPIKKVYENHYEWAEQVYRTAIIAALKYERGASHDRDERGTA